LRHGETVALEGVQFDSVVEKVYNFHVAQFQNYAVGVCGILVHNINNTPRPNAEQTSAIANGIQKEKEAWQKIKDKALAEGKWSEAEHADTQIQNLQNEIRKLFDLPRKPWLGG
jgi:hypothetical protein